MAKIIVLFSLVIASQVASAKFDCTLRLLSNHNIPINPSDGAFTATWMGTHSAALNDPNHPQWSTQNIAQRWSAWNAVTAEQREQALALELLKLSPKQASAQTVIDYTTTNLKALSSANLARMLKQLETLIPVSAATSGDAQLRNSINKTVARLDFNYTHAVNSLQFTISDVGYGPPLPSHRELKSLGLDSHPGFYSKLVDVSPSVAFDTQVTWSERAEQRASMANLLRREVFVLDRKFALDTGFALPKFASTKDLFDFFAAWDPEALNEIVRANRFNLPSSIATLDEFLVYLELNVDEAFPSDNAYSRLAPMRTRLVNYVLTTSDAEQLVKQGLRRFLLATADKDRNQAEEYFVNLSNSGAVMRIMNEKVMPALHFPSGLQLRIPVVATAENYTLSRVEGRTSGLAPHWNLPRRGPFYDPRPVDHDSKP